MADEINGWKPPLIYDPSIMQGRRIATQEDIDRLEAIAAAYGDLISQMERTHDSLKSRLEIGYRRG